MVGKSSANENPSLPYERSNSRMSPGSSPTTRKQSPQSHPLQKKWRPVSGKDCTSFIGGSNKQQNEPPLVLAIDRVQIAETPNKTTENLNSPATSPLEKPQLCSGASAAHTMGVSASAAKTDNSVNSEDAGASKPFDICRPKSGTPVMLKPSLLMKNRERRNEMRRTLEGDIGKVLRPGMVHLKHYLTMNDQVYYCNHPLSSLREKK